VYIGTWQCGIFVIKGGDVQVLNQDKGLPNDAVRAVYADKEGNLWVGMKDQGLAVLSRGRWWSPGELTEEVTEFVSAIAEDDQGRLVVGTSSGIKWAPKDQLLAAARGERAVPVFRTIGGEEGRSLAVWWGGDPIVWKAHDHTLYFATRRGLVVLDPARILENTVLPPVYIERVLVDGKPAGDGRKIDLPAGARDLTIEYTALSLPQPGSVLFKCKLNGYDKDWVNVGNRRSQSYDNLPPGNYVFQVQACNNDGRWNRRGDRIEIAQRPYFYQTGWFYGVVVGCVAGAAWWGHRYSQRQLQFKLERLEHKQAMEKERQRIARNLHDDLGAHLTEIGLFVERTKQKTPSPDAAKNLGSLSDRVRALTGALDAVVWAVDPANDSLDQLALYICGMLEDLFRLSPIRSRLDVAPDIPACPLTPEIRSNLFLTAKEAMNNVLKHSGATEVWLRIGLENDCFRMAIEDNGCGFDLSAVGRAKRNGLSNMKSRIEEMGGEFAVQSTLGQGTSVAMAVRLAGKRKV
ncbi:MAG: triple tyrosine motif-containing protein, partial [Opitutaceae bacterium]